MKDGGTHSSASTGLRIRAVLVAAEMAIALVLLTGAGLMLKSFARMYDHPASFQPEKIGSMKLFLSGAAYREPANCLAYAHRLQETLRRIPGIEAAAVTSAYGHGPAQVEGVTFPPGQGRRCASVTPLPDMRASSDFRWSPGAGPGMTSPRPL